MDHFSNLRDCSALREERFDDENVTTPTSTEQVKLEMIFVHQWQLKMLNLKYFFHFFTIHH